MTYLYGSPSNASNRLILYLISITLADSKWKPKVNKMELNMVQSPPPAPHAALELRVMLSVWKCWILWLRRFLLFLVNSEQFKFADIFPAVM